MHWLDGTVYCGKWMFGAQHGKGKLTLPDGDVKEGIFENNVYIGEVPEDYVSEEMLVEEEANDINEEDKPEQMQFDE